MADVPFLHFSAEPLVAVHSVNQNLPVWSKPNGLWVSVGSGEESWPAWCRSERFRLGRLAHATEVVLRTDASILRITSVPEIDAFHSEFGTTLLAGLLDSVDWAHVACRHQGIVIAPYRWERRLRGKCSSWYHGWDCASGCIWDADAVAGLRPIEGLDLHRDGARAA